MRKHRFFLDNAFAECANAHFFSFADPALAHQLSAVLRAKSGDPIELFNRDGMTVTGTIASLGKKEISITVEACSQSPRQTRTTTLYLAMLKRENFELAAQKATEIGITAIVPLLTERTIKTGFNRARLEKIAIEAAEQSGRTSIPDIADPMSLSDAIAEKYDKRIFLDFDAEPFDSKIISDMKTIALYVGPEGGWSEHERTLAEKNNCTIATISLHTLRAETAAIIGSYLIAER